LNLRSSSVKLGVVVKRFSGIFISLSFLLLPGSIFSQEKTVREIFADGYARFTQRDFELAEALLLTTLNRSSLLEDYSLYYLGEIALARGDFDVARSYFKQLMQNFPLSVWASQAEIQLAKSMIAAKDYPGATEILQRLRNQPAKREISDEALFLLAQIHELRGDQRQA
jgi:TolA-binding protein